MSSPLEDLPTVHVCAGPPACLLQGDEVIANCEAGCPRCARIAIHPDGSQTTYRLPSH